MNPFLARELPITTTPVSALILHARRYFLYVFGRITDKSAHLGRVVSQLSPRSAWAMNAGAESCTCVRNASTLQDKKLRTLLTPNSSYAGRPSQLRSSSKGNH